jgi:Multiubiquitin
MIEVADKVIQHVRIHVDRKTYKSGSPTSGEALYELAAVPEDRDLFLDLEDDQEDTLIPRNGTAIDLVPDEHFYTRRAKDVTLIVNLEEKSWGKKRISYEEVTLLAFGPPPPGIIITYTVEFDKGPRSNPEGSLTPGKSVKVREGMVFSVTETGRS